MDKRGIVKILDFECEDKQWGFGDNCIILQLGLRPENSQGTQKSLKVTQGSKDFSCSLNPTDN